MYSALIGRGTTGEITAGDSTTLEQFRRIQDLFDRTFKASRVGIWVCTLPDEKLTWTDTVFELFDLDPQSRLRREDIVNLYTPASREELGKLRSAAIRDGEGFSLDAEIITARGSQRWIRITAIVERVDGVATRLFGMKQDITTEKTIFDQIRRAAEVDSLTGTASRAMFDNVFSEICGGAGASSHGLFLIDLDGFKAVNDRLGHQAGDDCLALAGRKLLKALPDARLVARLGGDEFAVLHPCESPDALHRIGGSIVEALEYWWGRGTEKLKLTASVGATMIERDAVSKDVFSRADQALYKAKAAGKGGLQTVSDAAITHAA
ncbi:GGDEF domain-containing protein [Rhizobium sp. C4]|uniref:GGDEF domain-containing protein n=1 Tax=Rhizobium sp. C4 TaxID=1349800 RepID=UPI001E573479|nr:diguanylate cyclase [Rhizobium sp. C4]MCD2175641.1 diguanylate cyclase [Rhizobium sp. C4]